MHRILCFDTDRGVNVKYFIGYGCKTRLDINRPSIERDVEIPTERALKFYTAAAGTGKKYLVAIPNFRQGNQIRYSKYNLWGENISNAECFQRRLAGRLAKENGEI